MKLAASFLFSFGTKIFSLFILLIARVLTARILGPANLGSIGNALNLTTIISRWGSLGIAPAVQFTTSKYPKRRNVLLVYTITISATIGVLNWLVLIYFKKEISNWQFSSDDLGSYVFHRFLPWLPVIMLSMTLPIFLLGLGKIRRYSLIQILPLLFQTTILCSAFCLPEKVEIIIAAQLIYWIATVVIALTLVEYRSFSYQFDQKLLVTFSAYAIKSWPQVLLQFGISRFGILVGSQYLSTKDLGYFVLASNLSESFLLLNTSVTPLIFNKIAAGGSDVALLGRMLRFSNVAFLIAFVVSMVFGKPLFLLFFGLEFERTWMLFLELLVAVLFQGMIRFILNYLAALGHNITVSLILICQLAILFLIGIPACQLFGIQGLCHASLCAVLVGFVSCMFALGKFERDYHSALSLFSFQKDDIKLLDRLVKRFRDL